MASDELMRAEAAYNADCPLRPDWPEGWPIDFGTGLPLTLDRVQRLGRDDFCGGGGKYLTLALEEERLRLDRYAGQIRHAIPQLEQRVMNLEHGADDVGRRVLRCRARTVREAAVKLGVYLVLNEDADASTLPLRRLFDELLDIPA